MRQSDRGQLYPQTRMVAKNLTGIATAWALNVWPRTAPC